MKKLKNYISWLHQKNGFQKIKIKLNQQPGWLWSAQYWFSRPWNVCGLKDLNSLNSLSGLNDLNSLISQNKLLNFMFPSTMAPKRPILVSQWEMDHQKLIILLILTHFILEAVEASLWDQNKIWRIKVKFPNLMSTQMTSNQIWFTYFSLSGPNYKNHFALGHCVLIP